MPSRPRSPTSVFPHDLSTLSLEDVLRALGLEHAASQLSAALAKAIARNDSPSSLLDNLMREQLRDTTEARAKTALRRSAIFPLPTIDSYDFNYPKHIDRELVMRAASLDFIREKSNVVFIGPSGVGKTHLANALGQLACLRGYRVRFVVAADLVNDLVVGQAKNTLHKRLSAWAAPELLLIDELGYLSFDARGADLLYQVFNKRYQRASTIVTTNLPFKDWGKLFHNSAAASAIADRLVHKGLLVRITGKSRRSDQEQELDAA
ncbi:IS21-like element helper ATPase IstB [Myxococcus stipitatus]|uniref:IS21-like element helper ATPase IstB n=1 Tax=Myxococcus stipitatus TaxID=83455 RepID=UPI0030CC2015